ncbi:hypothetical protein DPMN_036964 [Dreissena polymorpha]|uniref:Ig-like domain-containing protein n=1 Tax=Dreissena polymorpha TaxID=45954 RepID=A0A9D4MA27_DREPO|nr:hypothetical protein DPMN_036964 [Dreissena polymorpha]
MGFSGDHIRERPKVHLTTTTLFGVSEVRVHAGEPLKMKLGITGSPTPIVIWAKEGKPIPRARTSNTHDYDILDLPKADYDDTGNYLVTVENKHGRDSADIPVIVIDKPGPPKGTLEVSDVFADSCQLAWKPPQDKGNSPIIVTGLKTGD